MAGVARSRLALERKNWRKDHPYKFAAKPVTLEDVYDNGQICLSIINPDADWAPSITVRQILLGIQELLENPNIKSAAQRKAYDSYNTNRNQYTERIRQQAKKYTPVD